jgi:hypothetical protein
MHSILLVTVVLGQYFVPAPDKVSVPEIPLLNRKPKPFVTPGGLFSVQVPPGWGVALHDDDPYTIDFKGVDRPGYGILQVRRIKVPRGAHPRQLLLVAIERRLSKLPNFKIADRRDAQVAGNRAAVVTGTYAYQGNLQYPVTIEELFVVTGEEAFIFHFECFAAEAGRLATDLNTFYTSFRPRPAGWNVNQGSPPQAAPSGRRPKATRSSRRKTPHR